MRFSSSNVRRVGQVAWVLALALAPVASGCTRLLDIDDEYELESKGGTTGAGGLGAGGIPLTGSGGVEFPAGGASNAELDSGLGGMPAPVATGGAPANAGGSGGEGGRGGAETASGGSALGGATSTGGATEEPDSGAPDTCASGTFVGDFKGSHATSITVIGVPFQVSGEVRFTLQGSGNVTRTLTDGTFTGTLNFIPTSGSSSPVSAPYTAAMKGVYDCDTKKLVGTLENGKFSAPEAQTPFRFSGEYTATLDANQFSGTYQEHEMASASYKGDGTFTAERSP